MPLSFWYFDFISGLLEELKIERCPLFLMKHQNQGCGLVVFSNAQSHLYEFVRDYQQLHFFCTCPKLELNLRTWSTAVQSGKCIFLAWRKRVIARLSCKSFKFGLPPKNLNQSVQGIVNCPEFFGVNRQLRKDRKDFLEPKSTGAYWILASVWQ